VHEVRARIEADAAARHSERGAVQPLGVAAFQPDVDRAPVDVQAVARDAAARFPQHGVRLRRAVTRDHLEAAPAAARVQSVELVEQPRVDHVDGLRTEVAQQPVHRLQRVGHVAAALVIGGGQALAGMRVIERHGARRAARGVRRRRGDEGQQPQPFRERPAARVHVVIFRHA
jgi:hypothetical protein